MRAAAAVAVVAVTLTVGCDTDTTAPDVGTPIARTATVELPDQPHHDDHHHGPPAGHASTADLDADGLAAAAVALITDGLEHQGLAVVDVAADTTRRSAERATVRVAATHTHQGRVHTSIYELTLTRDHHGGWRLVDARTVQ